ncbi:MAG: S-layer homology domain-containing protein [Candidatus Gracilibacteria bacterium]|jgi:hypothetical protein
MDISFAFRKIQKSIAGLSMLAILASLVSFTGIASAESFPDVSSSHYAADAVDEASDEGWMTGYENGDFGVDDSLTRAQAAKILVLGALGEDAVDADYDAGFSDVSSSTALEDYINTAEMYGIVRGRTDSNGDLTGEYDPTAAVNRAEFAKMAVEAFGLAAVDAAVDEFPDVDEGEWYEESPTWYISTAWSWSVLNGYENGNFYPGTNVTRGQAAIMTNNSQDPVWRDAEDPDPADPVGDFWVEISDDSPAESTIPSGATSVELVAWDFTAGEAAELDSLTVHQFGITSLSSTHQVYLYEGNERLTSGVSVNSTSHEATFNNVNLEFDDSETRTLSVRLDVGTTSSTGEVGFEIVSADKVDAGESEVDGDFPAQGELHTLSTTAAGVATIEKNGTVENAEVGEDGATIAKFKISTATEAGGVEEIGLYVSGSVTTADIESFKLYVSGDDSEPLAEAEAVDDNDVVRFDISGDWDSDSTDCENSDGYCITKGGSKSFYVTADFNTGRTDDTVEVYVDQSTDVLVRGALYGFGMSLTKTNYDGNANSCAASSDADCSYFTLEGGDITVSSNGPTAQDVATNSDDVSVLDFTIVSVTDVTFDSFEISMTATESSDTTEGLLNETAANFTDVKIWDNTNDEALFAGVDATSFKTGTGGATAIDETTNDTDDDKSYYLFTDDFSMSTGEEREFSLMTDIANTTTLDGMTFTANLELGSTYPQLKDVNNKTLTNTSVLVPASAITSKTMTVRVPSLAISLASTPTAGANTYVKGSEEVPFVGMALACGDSSDCVITNLTLTGLFDDDQDNTWETSSTSAADANDAGTNMTTVLGSVWLENGDGVEIAASKGVNNTTWAVTYDSLDWTIESGDTEVVYVMGDLSTNSASEYVTFELLASNVTVEDEDGSTFSATAGGSTSGTVNNDPTSTVGTFVSTTTGGSLTVAVSSSTAREDIAVAGSADVEIAKFEFTSTREAFSVTDLSINNKQVGIVSTDLGEWDNNVESVTVSYENADGDTVEHTNIPLVSGTAILSGLSFWIPADDSAYLTVYADLNSITSSGSSATAGEFIDLNIGFNNFEAIAQGSGETYKGEELDATVSADADLDFGTISYTDADGSLEVDGATAADNSAALGATASLVIDDAAGDNSNKLPVGSVICIDDDDSAACTTEDIYIVTVWDSSVSGTEDTVTAMLIDDAGDQDYDDNDPILYSLPGTGYLTTTNRMHVYESKPTLALASSSPSGSRSVNSSDEVFAFTVYAESEEKVQIRTAEAGDDENDPVETGMDDADVALTTTGGEVVDGTSAVEVTFDANSVDDNDCFLLDEAYTAGNMDDYTYVSFWVNSSETDVTYDTTEVVFDDDSTCTAGGDDQIDFSTSNTWINGTALSAVTNAIGGANTATATADRWELVTVNVSSGTLTASTYFGFNVSATDGTTDWAATDQLRVDGVVFHNELLVVDVAADTDFNTDEVLTVSLKESGNTVAQGGMGYLSTSAAKVVLLPGGLNTSDAYTTIEVDANETKTYTLVLDSGTMLDEDGGADDPVTFSIDLGSSSDGTVTPGDFWWYETNSTVRWVGRVDSSTLVSNTVRY